jgi:hypothetical protein
MYAVDNKLGLANARETEKLDQERTNFRPSPELLQLLVEDLVHGTDEETELLGLCHTSSLAECDEELCGDGVSGPKVWTPRLRERNL